MKPYTIRKGTKLMLLEIEGLFIVNIFLKYYLFLILIFIKFSENYYSCGSLMVRRGVVVRWFATLYPPSDVRSG
jgi:hypothetical protein